VQSTVTLSSAFFENGELGFVRWPDEELRNARRWTRPVSVRRVTPRKTRRARDGKEDIPPQYKKAIL
jgi:hypothetical protein